MSPTTAFGTSPSTLAIKLSSLTVAFRLKRPGTLNAIVRPCMVALRAIAAFTTPCGVAHSWNCRSASAMGAATGCSPTMFHARSPLTCKFSRCSPRMGCTPPERGGSSACVRTCSSRREAVS